jgi:DNA-binding CsgD family transcriptional regulator
MRKNILVIYTDSINENKLKKILVRSSIINSCTFKSYLIEDVESFDIILTHINDFKYLAEFKIFIRKITCMPVLNIIDEGDLELFSLIEDRAFKIIKIDFTVRGCLKKDIKNLQSYLVDKIHLTDREEQILGFISQGMCVDDISLKLGISTKTVIAHKRNLFIKANVHSINQLMLWSFNRI